MFVSIGRTGNEPTLILSGFRVLCGTVVTLSIVMDGSSEMFVSNGGGYSKVIDTQKLPLITCKTKAPLVPMHSL